MGGGRFFQCQCGGERRTIGGPWNDQSGLADGMRFQRYRPRM